MLPRHYLLNKCERGSDCRFTHLPKDLPAPEPPASFPKKDLLVVLSKAQQKAVAEGAVQQQPPTAGATTAVAAGAGAPPAAAPPLPAAACAPAQRAPGPAPAPAPAGEEQQGEAPAAAAAAGPTPADPVAPPPAAAAARAPIAPLVPDIYASNSLFSYGGVDSGSQAAAAAAAGGPPPVAEVAAAVPPAAAPAWNPFAAPVGSPVQQLLAETAQYAACIGCWEVPARAVLIPCGHVVLCEACASGLYGAWGTQKGGPCPMCRQQVRGRDVWGWLGRTGLWPL